MTKEERNKYLTEHIGDHWYEWEPKRDNVRNPDFSTWEDFGKLKTFMEKQSYWYKFLDSILHTDYPDFRIGKVASNISGIWYYVDFYNPDPFAEAAYEFLVGEEKEVYETEYTEEDIKSAEGDRKFHEKYEEVNKEEPWNVEIENDNK